MNKNCKKTEEDVKAELLKPIKETNEEYNAQLSKNDERVTRLEDVISAIKQYEEVTLFKKSYWTADQTRVYFF